MSLADLKMIGWMLLTLVCILVLVTCCTSCLINRVVFHPTPGVARSLDALGPGVSHVYIETSDEVRVSAFYLEKKGAPLTVLFFHGNAGNASHRLDDAEMIRSLGVNVLLMDYRGYGLSDGRPTEKGVYLDAAAGLAFLEKEKKTPKERVVVYGRSLGSVAAVKLAEHRPLAGVILVSPFTSGKEMAPCIFKPFIGHPLDSLSRIENLRSPLLILHGEQDTLVPVEMGRRLHDRAKVDKRLTIIEGAGHNDLISVSGDLFFSEIEAFLKRVTPPS
jgi:pimeloyl-ACP methyl ester carboxylesterase